MMIFSSIIILIWYSSYMNQDITFYIVCLLGIFFFINFIFNIKRNKQKIKKLIQEKEGYVLGNISFIIGSFPPKKIPLKNIFGRNIYSSQYYKVKFRYNGDILNARVFVSKPASKNPYFIFCDLNGALIFSNYKGTKYTFD